jgi:hypothetical protein
MPAELPLTLSEQLDAMLTGWLERRNDQRGAPTPGSRATSVVTVAHAAVEEVARFCAGWGLTIQRHQRRNGPWALLVVEGPALPVQGFSEITAMCRR